MLGEIDAPKGIEADHTRRHAREDRLDKAPPGIDLLVGLHKLRALAFQLTRHAVEGAAQGAQFIGSLHFHPRRQIAGTDAIRGRHEAGDRLRQFIGEIEPHPGRDE